MDKRALRVLLTLTAGLLLCIPAGAGAQQPRIINGTLPSQAWPAQTSLLHLPNRVCGATLVSARWVLTAGHCVTSAGSVAAADQFRLRIGSTSRSTGGFESLVDGVVRHPSYGGPATSPRYDLALLHLPAPAPQEPIPIVGAAPRDAEFWAAGVPATIIGWGVTENGQQSNTQLREAKAPIVADPTCTSAWNTFSAASMVCAGNETTDTCGGDSGGPLMVSRLGLFALVGVTSWGSGECGQPDYPSPGNPIDPGVYARLGDPAINAWVRGYVPTLAVSTSPATPFARQPFTLSAIPTAGGPPSIAWDTNGDGAFGDAAGPQVSLTFPSAGTYTVSAWGSFADSDRSAIAREQIVVADPPPPPPPPPAPPPAPPPPPPPPAAPRTLTNGVDVTPRIKLLTLRTKGVRVRFECARACTIRGRLSLGPVSARRFGLGGRGKSVTIGSATKRLTAAGSATLTLKLTSRAKRALRNRERATISVITTLTAGSARVPDKTSVSVRR